MILVDTGALYALANQRDSHHREAQQFYQQVRGRETLATPISVVVETALLVEARMGPEVVRALWDDLIAGVFELLDVTQDTIAAARRIDQRYADANFGLVDATCLALCEQHRITRVFTYDRRDFAIYRPTFAKALDLVP